MWSSLYDMHYTTLTSKNKSKPYWIDYKQNGIYHTNAHKSKNSYLVSKYELIRFVFLTEANNVEHVLL